ncbi:MAG: SurA N-terminal domain-containing protein [Lachnospiraceae bacterium]|nr:SurA N-terminal domain-containing protein [Lachnospiraceae bacterium]
MNSSKKIVREGAKANQNDKKKNNGDNLNMDDKKRLVLGVIFGVLLLAMCIVVGVQQFKKDVVLKVNDTKYTMDDMMYPIYETESQYLAMNSMYQYYMNSTVWEAAYSGDDKNVDSSATNEVGLKQQIMDQTQEYEILYQAAVKAGYKVTEEDTSSAKTSADEALKHLSFKQKLKLGFTKNSLVKLFEKRNVANRYKEDNRAVTDGQVDEAEAIKGISKEDYKQYDVEYFSVSLVTKEGEDLKPEKREKRLKQLKDVLERSEDEDDFSKVLKEENEEADQVTFNTASFTEGEGWSMITNKDILKKVKKLKKGEVSDIIEDDDDNIAFFVKLADDTSTESYDTACDEAIKTAKDAKYDEWYESVAKDFNVKINQDVWDEITIGTVTTSIVTEEDLQKWAEEDNAGNEDEATSETAGDTTEVTSEE